MVPVSEAPRSRTETKVEMPPVEDAGKTGLKTRIQQLIDSNQVVVFSKSYCPYCVKVSLCAGAAVLLCFYQPGHCSPRRATSTCWVYLLALKPGLKPRSHQKRRGGVTLHKVNV